MLYLRPAAHLSNTPKETLADVKAAIAAAAEESANCVVEMLKIAAKDRAINRTDALMILREVVNQHAERR